MPLFDFELSAQNGKRRATRKNLHSQLGSTLTLQGYRNLRKFMFSHSLARSC